MTNRFVVVDLETTGNSPKKGDKIIQFAAVVVENGEIKETFSSLVSSDKPIPLFIEELTGLNNDMLKDAPTFSEIAPKILQLLDGAFFVAHNVLFDLSFLQEELINSGYEGFFGPVIDTVELSRIVFPTADSFKLTDLATKEGLAHDRPHQADSDAYVTAELFLILIKLLRELPEVTLRQLLRLAGGLKSDISLLLDEYVLGKSSTRDVIPEELEIFHGLVLRKKEEIENIQHSAQGIYPSTPEEIEAMFLRAFNDYEKRDGQVQMLDHVYSAFLNERHALIEAGTGVGKSMAYLLPSAIFSNNTNNKIVVSTYTTQLQEQLLTKDIPLLKKMVDFPLEVVLLKGRHHYISLEKFHQTLYEEEDNYDTSLTKMQILVWLTHTETGDYEELNLSSGGLLYWNRIKNDSSSFVKDRSWLSHDFYFLIRQRVNEAKIIITNHSLLMADLNAENSILPPFEYVIIDEAHHFEKAVGKSFNQSIDYLSLRMLLSQFGSIDQRQTFYELEQIFKNTQIEDNHKLLHSFQINEMIVELQFEIDDLFRAVALFVKRSAKKGNQRLVKRVSHDESAKEWSSAVASAERCQFLLKDLYDSLNKWVDFVKSQQLTLDHHQRITMNEVVSFLDEIEEIRSHIKNLIIKPLSNQVTWIEMDARATQNLTSIYSQPVSISRLLKENFFDKKKSAVLTSATMTVNQSFDFVMDSLGLEEKNCSTLHIPSPFAYKEQVQVLIPDDLPEINKVPLSDYVAAITEHIISIAEATKGRMLILFTSYDMLRKTYDLIKESGLLDDYVLFAQGITSGSRSRLTRNFQRFEKSILLGTSSFWEGIDIPGEALSCLVIVRLPFTPPDDPIAEAKSEIIQAEGQNPFSKHSLPEAVLRFKQGFGRLIRKKTDRGFVIIFDRRIVTTTYGKAFLKSIPTVPVKTLDINEMLNIIEDWL
ncbi:ATP-dependent DNA helicase DinG [Robertmurraya korlensis]|uniref:ATP-dependent DNA helicase DinG n=1 Tax=Robertmurraya korlensis TaxID=519977 RepID=UPI000824DF65|nr:ATP-dependent DNA helicase DinG [Robertmurraya korlensis]